MPIGTKQEPIVATYGRATSDHALWDVVAQPNGELALAILELGEVRIVPTVFHQGVLYHPPQMRPGELGAIRLPSGFASTAACPP